MKALCIAIGLTVLSGPGQAAQKAVPIAQFPSMGTTLTTTPLALHVKVSGANKEYSAVLSRESDGKICLHRAYRYDGKAQVKIQILSVADFQTRYREFVQIYGGTQNRRVACDVTVHVTVLERKKRLLEGTFCAGDLNAEELDRFNKWLSLF